MSEVAPLTPPARAASDEIRAELIELRGRDGGGERKLREYCPQLLSLQAVADEVKRRGFAPTDRHVAAWQVLQCACQILIGRPLLTHILERTLNFGEQDGDLERRRSAIRSSRHITPKAYRRLEEEAYVLLASRLVAADGRPVQLRAGAGTDSNRLDDPRNT